MAIKFNVKISGQLYLWVAVILFATSNSVVRKLNEIGSQHLINGINPISPCNVLFVSNICALLVLIATNYRQLNLRLWKEISRGEWLNLIIVAILGGAIAPGFIFQALTLTKVTNVVLIGRIEPPLILALSVWLLKERVTRWEIMGAFVCFVGVCIIFLLKLMGMRDSIAFGAGEILTLLGVSAGAIATIIARSRLMKISFGTFSVIRNSIATIVFFALATYLYGLQHFAEAFSPFLWEWMLVYGTVIVAFGQFCWSKGLRATNLSQATLANSFNPVVAIIAAYLILQEQPTAAEYLGGSIIICGLLLSYLGIRRKAYPTSIADKLKSCGKIEGGMGFKGV